MIHYLVFSYRYIFFQWPQKCPGRIWIRPDTTDPEHCLCQRMKLLWYRIHYSVKAFALTLSFIKIMLQSRCFYPLLWIRIGFSADPNPAFSHSADVDPDPGQTFKS
jgi:hypothetical protein